MSIALSRRPPRLQVPQAAHEAHIQAADDSPLLRLIDETLDGQGMPRGGQLDQLLPLFLRWTEVLSDSRAKNAVNTAELHRYRKFVENLLRLARGDGTIVFGVGRPHEWRKAWCSAAELLEPRVQQGGRSVFRTQTAGRTKLSDVPSPSANCETAGIAVLRPHWSAPRLVVDYHSTELHIELDRSHDAILLGECDPRVTIDGERLTPLSRWEQTCWITDDDVDYLEIELALSREVRVQRHLMFARQDEFVFIGDAVLGHDARTIGYELPLPLAAGVASESAAETRETALVGKARRRARVLPLSLGEWRSERRRGDWHVDEGSLRLTQSAAKASNLFAACFIDLAPRRLSRPVTWRQLTVAEDRLIQPDDVAVGYRVQAGNRQWLFYRSLAACGNRTVLGHNLVSEFLAARFSRQGIAETLIEIEAPADEDG